MNKSLQKQPTGAFVDPVALQQIEHLANKLQNSGALPRSIENGAQLTMVLLAGYDAGMSPMESVNSYYIVNGKVTIYGDAVIRQLRRAGWVVKWDETTTEKATVTIENGQQTHTETYTIEEAKQSGLLGRANSPWGKYPKEMLRHKAIGRAVRFTCPEVLGGHYLKEELDGVEPFDTTGASEVMVTDEQLAEIDHLIKELDGERSALEKKVMDWYGCKIEQLTQTNAANLIEKLKERKKQKDQPNPPKQPTPEAQKSAEAAKTDESEPIEAEVVQEPEKSSTDAPEAKKELSPKMQKVKDAYDKAKQAPKK